jgi:thiol-disulfide isomerase/thioredoxin
MRPSVRTLLAVLLIVGGVSAGFLSYRALHRASSLAITSAAPAGSADSTTTAAAAPAPTSSSRSLPQTLPEVPLADLTGRTRSLAEFRGHPLVVNFWATWCEPCRREMPLLQSMRAQHSAEGLQVLGIAVDSRSAVEQYLRTTTVDYPIFADETLGSAAMSALGLEQVLPVSVFADAQGRIVNVKTGELHRDEADVILAAVQQTSTGRQSLAEARGELAGQLRALAIQRARQSVQP